MQEASTPIDGGFLRELRRCLDLYRKGYQALALRRAYRRGLYQWRFLTVVARTPAFGRLEGRYHFRSPDGTHALVIDGGEQGSPAAPSADSRSVRLPAADLARFVRDLYTYVAREDGRDMDSKTRDRIAKRMQEEVDGGRMAYYWMSFCDSDRPEGEQFLGVVILRALGVTHAMWQSHVLGINPGGEVLVHEILTEPRREIQPGLLNRLLSRADLQAAGLLDGGIA